MKQSSVPEFTASSAEGDVERQRRIEDNYRSLQRLFRDTTYYRGTGDVKKLNGAALLAMATYAKERWPEAKSNLAFGFSSKGEPWGVANRNTGHEGELLWDVQKDEHYPAYVFNIADESNGPAMLKRNPKSVSYSKALSGYLK